MLSAGGFRCNVSSCKPSGAGVSPLDYPEPPAKEMREPTSAMEIQPASWPLKCVQQDRYKPLLRLRFRLAWVSGSARRRFDCIADHSGDRSTSSPSGGISG